MRTKFKKIVFMIIFVLCATLITAPYVFAEEPQQSKSTARPPLKVVQRDALMRFMQMGVPPIAPVVIPGVPNYLWRHGCGPTAVGHVVGYYDGQGYSDLITGDASTQTNDVNQAMASGGDSTNPNPAGSEKHYEDYARPEDASPTLLTDNYITAGRTAHTNDCIGDYQDTSKSTRANYYGWSWSNDLGPSFVNYVNLRNASYNPTYTQYQWGSTLTWAVLTNEINNNRPMVFLVDSGGDGSTDHFVAVVGYDAATNQYGCHDSWDNTQIRWETFQGMANGRLFGIWGGWSFNLGPLGEVTKWEQPPDTTPYGMDVRCDRRDGMQRVLADDFQCTTTGPITKVRIWGSWKNDIKGQIRKIHLSVHSDDPVGPGGTDPTNTYSKPDYLLWSKDFNVPDFTETQFMDITPLYEYWWDPITGLLLPNGDHKIWQYDITIDQSQAFVQQGGPTAPIVYWLDAYAVLDLNSPAGAEFGWKTSMMHWNDDAVWSGNNGTMWHEMRYPPGHPYAPDSADLAFSIITGTTTEPNEPNEPEPNIPNSKYIQPPDLTPNGIDIRLDDADGVTRHIADDFPCNTPGPITDVHFWGSWKNDLKGNITAIIVSIYDDNSLPPYSRPKTLLWQHRYMAGDFNETLYKDLTPEYEWWWDPFFNDLNQYGDHQVWKYDIKIDPRMAFRQDGNTTNPKVYWLELQAWLPYGQTYKFGWKTSRQHWNDDAVFANGSNPPYTWIELLYPQGHPDFPESIDMAFAVTTGAEPNIPTDPNTKFKQPPDESPLGIDIRCDRQDMLPRILADDFVCFERGAITDVHLWGSWKGEPNMKGEVNSIHLSIHSDIPSWQDPNRNYSMPGPVLWQRDIQVGDFKETLYKTMTYYEGWWDASAGISGGYIPNGDRQIWQYDIVIPPSAAFIQQGEPNKPVIYWLDVYVQLKSNKPTAQFGWKTSTEHFNDNAVYFDLPTGQWKPMSYPEMHPLYGKPIDMAFSITNTKECMKPWATEYARWVTYRKPACWCCRRNCRGDADCVSTLGKPVAGPDLTIFKGAYNLAASVVRDLIVSGKPAICADFDRKDTLGKPVAGPDLTIFKAYYNKALTQVPCCDLNGDCVLTPADKYIFWTN